MYIRLLVVRRPLLVLHSWHKSMSEFGMHTCKTLQIDPTPQNPLHNLK